MALILSETDLAPLYQDANAMDALLATIEDSLRAHNRGELSRQLRFEPSLLNAKKKFRIMTAAVPHGGQGIRINALFPGARDANFILLFHGETGDLLGLVAGGELNVWRTGSAAGIASRYLAQPGAGVLGLIGSGRQARGQLLAIRRSLPSLQRVRVYSPNEEHRIGFAKAMSAWLGIAVEAVNDARSAVEGAPIVSLATSSRSTVIDAGWLAPGTLVVSITSGQLPQGLIAGSRVIASWKEEVLNCEPPREPYATMVRAGTWSGDRIVAELGEVLLGKVPPRENERDIVVFESVGMPSWDACAAAWAYRWALDHQVGTPFSLA